MSLRADLPHNAVPPDAQSATGRQAVILLVDDDPDCRLLIRDAIADAHPGTIVYEMASAQQALRFLQRTGPFADAPRPQLIYLDVEMPGMNGIELAALVKGDRALSDIPVVMLTGVCDDERIRAAAVCGANSYTIKPSSAVEFFKTVADATRYWLTVHQYPDRHLPAALCRR